MAIEHFINILIINDDQKLTSGLKEILSGSGNNVLAVNDYKEAIPIIRKREVGIILINLDSKSFSGMEILQELKNESITTNTYKILITQSSTSAAKMVRGLNSGAVDFISAPFSPNLVKAKIEVYKTLFYKDQRIVQLLQNIFPMNVLEDFNTYGKFSPKRIENGVVLFTDFVDFSMMSTKLEPIQLLRQLEKYFTAFDEIINRYRLEKIKTIGDAYMALGGVTENKANPAIRACLAALEIQQYIESEAELSKAFGQDYWQIRIGIHMGPLVAGIIGKTKFNFDVWGDSVNIASRAERASKPGCITITDSVYDAIGPYFNATKRGEVDIQKRGGKVMMYFLDGLKEEYMLNKQSRVAGRELREACDLTSIDFYNMRYDIINKLKALLPEALMYHDVQHSLNVEKAAMRYGKLEGISHNEMLLLRTAVLYHDAGFILKYNDNEDFAIELAEGTLPTFGYNKDEIAIIRGMINATKSSVEPVTLLEKILCDADHDYLGRVDYRVISSRLRGELEVMTETFMNEKEWVEYQLNYLVNKHCYYTETAKNIRNNGKNARIQELKNLLETLKK
ncbi:MAG: response regulator [Crocinitomicaceae bacterium]|nr:response regulator [Crocinitomicaceae bacterium]